MTTSIRFNALVGALLLALPFAAASGASLTYRGTLQDGGKPAEGKYDIQLTLYAAAAGGRAIGAPIVLHAVPVQNGTFSTEVDFGAAANSSGPYWVAAAVAPADSGNFVALDARTPASVDAPASTCDGSWTLDGNAGNPTGSYLGTTDNQPLQFMVDGQPVGLLWASNTPGQPNISFGSNSISGDVVNGTISGGASNFVSAAGGTIAGGDGNTASGTNAFVAGWNNTAAGLAASAPGGQGNSAAGRSSFAAGFQASAANDGSFVWADYTNSSFGSTAANQFLIRATGGVGIGTNNPNGNQLRVVSAANAIDGETSGPGWAVTGINTDATGNGAGVYGQSDSGSGYGVAGINNISGGVGVLGYTVWAGAFGMEASNGGGGTALYVNTTGGIQTTRVIDTSTGAYLSLAGVWQSNSDRNKKFGFTTLDSQSVLAKVVALPVTRWSYKVEGDSIHHIGPMAQDFHAAFNLGNDNRTIGTVDEAGVALAAIQGLNQKLDNDNRKITEENAALKAQNAALVAKLDQLDARMATFEVAQHEARAAKLEVAQQGE